MMLKTSRRIYLATTQAGDTALILASFSGHLEVVQALLAAGADKEVKNQGGGGWVVSSWRSWEMDGGGQVPVRSISWLPVPTKRSRTKWVKGGLLIV